MTILALADLVKLVKVGITNWQMIRDSWGSRYRVEGSNGLPMTLDEVEPHIKAAETAREIASANAGTRIEHRHKGDS